MPYYELDAQFMNSIEQRMREIGDVDDDDLKQAFQNYTQLMVDLALISEDSMFNYDPQIKNLIKIYQHRLNLMKKTSMF